MAHHYGTCAQAVGQETNLFRYWPIAIALADFDGNLDVRDLPVVQEIRNSSNLVKGGPTGCTYCPSQNEVECLANVP